MTQAARTTITLLVLGVALAVAGVWGWRATMEPLPAKPTSAVCVATRVAAGEKVYPQQVTVSVYNSGRREGLAGRTMQLLKDQGFVRGSSGNAASAKVRRVAIWTTTPTDPDVQLVASYFGKGVDIERRKGPGVGVTVVVGDEFTELAKGRAAVRAASDTTICSPPVN
ncbi:LytR C-terminal domain-containing protein [Nocardioides sp. URHA0020]|uniref:LytR C-terminal domain-containing protein n=1 Tax=Nocardioides sp. URHA0020 TaxID=1380392 RepID=UPI00048FE7FC|nr:LytR C-terminal domain-containing protein [Nocardioides sp. URHA0020]